MAVLSEIGWTTRFKRDPAIVGRTLHLNNQIRHSDRRRSRTTRQASRCMPPILVPYTQASCEYFRDPGRHAWLDLSGRLAPGRSLDQANAELNVIATALDRRTRDARRKSWSRMAR